jgi:hypothetical protein
MVIRFIPQAEFVTGTPLSDIVLLKLAKDEVPVAVSLQLFLPRAGPAMPPG